MVILGLLYSLHTTTEYHSDGRSVANSCIDHMQALHTTHTHTHSSTHTTARVHVHTQTTRAPSHQCAFKLFLGFHFSICFCCCKRTSRRLSISSVLYSPVATIGVHPVVCAVFCRRAGVPVPTSPDVPIACFETCPPPKKIEKQQIKLG